MNTTDPLADVVAFAPTGEHREVSEGEFFGGAEGVMEWTDPKNSNLPYDVLRRLTPDELREMVLAAEAREWAAKAKAESAVGEEPDGGNLYNPHSLWLGDRFWRCKHGTTGFERENAPRPSKPNGWHSAWVGCPECHKEAFPKGPPSPAPGPSEQAVARHEVPVPCPLCGAPWKDSKRQRLVAAAPPPVPGPGVAEVEDDMKTTIPDAMVDAIGPPFVPLATAATVTPKQASAREAVYAAYVREVAAGIMAHNLDLKHVASDAIRFAVALADMRRERGLL